VNVFDIAGQHAAAEIAERGVRSLGLSVDATSEDAVRKLAGDVLAAFRRVDILVNAAIVTVRKRAEDLPVGDWRHVLDVNATGTFICCRVFGEQMMRQGGGVIVNLSSVRGRYGAKFGQTEYSASKGAVAPTFVETDLTRAVLADERFAATLRDSIPMGRWADTPDVVGPVLFLVSPAAAFITGQILFVDGGLSARI
jgi:NAD(P)-dependent dehydrogenase (short-subunit alcohol dehydrogenase family)